MGGRPSYPSSSCLPLPWVPPGRPQKLTSGGGGASGPVAGRVPSSEHVPREAEGAAGSCHPECLARDPGRWSGLTERLVNQVGTPSSGPRPSRHGVKPGWAKMPVTPFAGWQGCFSSCLSGLLGEPLPVRFADRFATRCLKFGLPWPPS